MNSVKGVAGVKGVKGVAGLGLPMREPYDVNVVMEQDLELIEVIKVLADDETNPITKKALNKVTSRLTELTSRAHTRGHWTGTE